MASKYTNISIHFPEEFEEELEMFKLNIVTDKNINIKQKYENARLFSFAIRYIIKEYNNYRKRQDQEKQKKENKLNQGDPSNAQTNSNQNS